MRMLILYAGVLALIFTKGNSHFFPGTTGKGDTAPASQTDRIQSAGDAACSPMPGELPSAAIDDGDEDDDVAPTARKRIPAIAFTHFSDYSFSHHRIFGPMCPSVKALPCNFGAASYPLLFYRSLRI